MYAGEGLHVCDPSFFVVEPGGKRRSINWLQVLGYPHPQDAPISLRRIEGCREALDIGRRLRAHIGLEVDLRLTARISTPYGWTTAYEDHSIPADTAQTAP